MEKFLKDLMPTMEKEGQKIAQDFIDRQHTNAIEDGERACYVVPLRQGVYNNLIHANSGRLEGVSDEQTPALATLLYVD